jgi:hypothetical protein
MGARNPINKDRFVKKIASQLYLLLEAKKCPYIQFVVKSKSSSYGDARVGYRIRLTVSVGTYKYCNEQY